MRNADTSKQGRREFLKRAAVTGGAATALAAGGAAVAGVESDREDDRAATKPEAKGYHVTDHIEDYYRLARF